MKRSDLGLIVLACAVCAIILVGEFTAYGNVYHYDASANEDGTYSVYDSGSHNYTATVSDNGTFVAPTELLIYYDESYGCVVHEVWVEVGARALTQDYYLSQLVNNLNYYLVTAVKYVNAQELAQELAGSGTGKGLVVISGALPETVYKGESSDLIFTWIHSGGSLYWAGETIGKYCGLSDGTVKAVKGDYQSLFLGESDCLNNATEDGRAYSEITDNRYSQTLSLKNNNVLYGVKNTVAGTLAIGYTQDGYASVSLTKNADGMVCVFGGNYSNNQRMDMATVIASGICYCSQELDCNTGNVTRGTVTGSFTDIPSVHGNLSVFIYLGGDFSVYGKSFHFNGS